MFLDQKAFQQNIKSLGRLLAIDLGEKNIGISISDVTRTIASPFQLLKHESINRDMEAIKKIVLQESIVGVVVGLPLNMNGSQGPQAQKAIAFAQKLCGYLKDTPVTMVDERLTTMAVTKVFLDADLSRKKRSQAVDKMAATYFLQNFLDQIKI